MPRQCLQTQTTEVSTVMESSSIASLPLETRNYNQLTLLIPGAVTISPASFNTGQKTFNAARPNLNGNREQANYYLLDGMENTEFVDNNVAYSPNVDAIQEFNVITNNPECRIRPVPGRRDQRQSEIRHQPASRRGFRISAQRFFQCQRMVQQL